MRTLIHEQLPSRKHIAKFVKYLDWKLNYLKANSMLLPTLLAQDVNEMCRLIDKSTGNEEETDNFAINECLAFVSHSLMPVLRHDDNQHLITDSRLQNSFVNLIDIITLRCKLALLIDAMFRVGGQDSQHPEKRS